MSEENKNADDPPPGFKKVEVHAWEAVDVSAPREKVNGHSGMFAYHEDDCHCLIAGWPCSQYGVWSCCGETKKYCCCTKKSSRPKGNAT